MRIFIFFIFLGSLVLANTVTPDLNSTDSVVQESDSFDEFSDFQDEFSAELEQSASNANVEIYDPLKGYNRAMTAFNDKMMIYVMEPTVKGYRYVVPEGGRESVHHFFKNLYYPVSFTNNILQFKIAHAGNETLRFLINSTVGLLGLFDPADKWFGIKEHQEDFGQTLGHYGVGSGFPVVLPLFGQRNLRDLVGTGADSFSDPLYFVDHRFYNTVEEYWLSVTIKGYDDVNNYSLQPDGTYESLTKDAIDLYPFIRDAYEQRRNKLIKE